MKRTNIFEQYRGKSDDYKFFLGGGGGRQHWQCQMLLFCTWVSHVMLISVSARVSYILPRAISYAYVGVIYLEHDIFTWYRPEGYEYKTVFFMRMHERNGYDLALFPPQCHFVRNTSKEYIIVLKNELDGKQETTVEPRFNEEPWEWQHSRATQRRFLKFTENTF